MQSEFTRILSPKFQDPLGTLVRMALFPNVGARKCVHAMDIPPSKANFPASYARGKQM